VIIGEALVGHAQAWEYAIGGSVMGSILFRLLVAVAAAGGGLNPNDLKLIIPRRFVFPGADFCPGRWNR